MPLTEDRRTQLDGIVSQMIANKEPEDNIKFVVADFKNKYGQGFVPSDAQIKSSGPKTQADFAVPGGSISPKGLLELIKNVGKAALEGAPQAVGATIGGTVFSPLGPPGIIGGAGLGAATAGTLKDVWDQITRKEKAPGLGQAILRRVTDVAMGATQEAAPLVARAVNQAGDLGGSLTSEVVTKDVSDKLIKGIKPTNRKTDFRQTLEKAVPEVNKTAQEAGGKIESLNDLIDTISGSKKRIWDEYEDILNKATMAAKQELGKAKELGKQAQTVSGKLKLQDESSVIRPMQEEVSYMHGEAVKKVKTGMEKLTIDGNKIADAMESVINRRLERQAPEAAQRIRDIAATYRKKPLTLKEAEEFLQDVNNDLASYYAKTKTNRNIALKDPEKAYVVKEGEALRTELYKKLDEIPGKDAAALKRKYGSLSSLEEEALRRKNVAERQNPDSLSEQVAGWSGLARAGAGLLRGDLVGVAQGIGERQLAKAIKKSNTTDELVKKAFRIYNTGLVKTTADEFLMRIMPFISKSLTDQDSSKD